MNVKLYGGLIHLFDTYVKTVPGIGGLSTRGSKFNVRAMAFALALHDSVPHDGRNTLWHQITGAQILGFPEETVSKETSGAFLTVVLGGEQGWRGSRPRP